MRTLFLTALVLFAAVVCDTITLASGNYSRILTTAIALACAGTVLSGVGIWRIKSSWMRIGFALLGLVALVVIADAVGRLL